MEVTIEERIPLLEEILLEWKDVIGAEYLGYRNHVYRMIHFCLALNEYTDEEKEKIIIAGAFHDMGIWIDDTIDYIKPSIPPALHYLKQRKLDSWSTEIKQMISYHHKIREYKGDFYPLVESFRKADLIDLSLGMITFGLPKELIKKLKSVFPNAGFHKNIGVRTVKWFMKHPLDPVPMMKW